MKKKFKKIVPLITLALFLITNTAQSTDFSGEAIVGYNGGFGFQLNFVTANFARDFPMNVQLGLAYTSMNPGNAADARKIFINDATNGDPEKSGWMWDVRFDFLYQVKWLSLQRAYLYGGPRYAMFTANFNFIGGNEDFDITSDQWGLGLGLKAYFTMGTRFDFVSSAGFDYYFLSELSGHDTRYNPDGENVNARNDYTFDDADNAVNNPTFQLRFLVGLNYHF
jgi:hypothetical protein